MSGQQQPVDITPTEADMQVDLRANLADIDETISILCQGHRPKLCNRPKGVPPGTWRTMNQDDGEESWEDQ